MKSEICESVAETVTPVLKGNSQKRDEKPALVAIDAISLTNCLCADSNHLLKSVCVEVVLWVLRMLPCSPGLNDDGMCFVKKKIGGGNITYKSLLFLS